MMSSEEHDSRSPLELTNMDFLGVLDAFDEGVIITDAEGRIIYYNKTQSKIDGLDSKYALGRKVTEIYDLDENKSMIMTCLKTRTPTPNKVFFYRTRSGRIANTIHSVYPLLSRGSLTGAICFVRDYKTIEDLVTSPATFASPAAKSKKLTNCTRFTFSDVIGSAPEFSRVLKTAKTAANSPSPVMIYGQTGTGKELIAQSIHNYSQRNKYRYIAINCAAIPENLLEGILFGTCRGAFTGALDKAGLFEVANGGTLFLDEVDSMPIGLQAKLLRVLQERKVRRVGSLEETDVDLKIISSVNTEPHRAIKEGILRIDLFYRLGVVFISIPPLRERDGDLMELCSHFLQSYNKMLGKYVAGISPEVADLFQKYSWPGNVRELQHVIEGAMNLVLGEEIIDINQLPEHFLQQVSSASETRRDDRQLEVGPALAAHRRLAETPGKILAAPAGTGAVRPFTQIQEDHEKEAIREALNEANGNVTRAAENLGFSRQLLHYKMKKHRLQRHAFLR